MHGKIPKRGGGSKILPDFFMTKPSWDNLWVCNCIYGHYSCTCDGATGKPRKK